MPSIIQADQLKSANGVTTYLNSGTLSNLTFPAGHVLQVKSTTKADTWSGTPGNGVFLDITGLSVSITPTSSSSKILVTFSTNVSAGDASTTGVRLVRDSTPKYW